MNKIWLADAVGVSLFSLSIGIIISAISWAFTFPYPGGAVAVCALLGYGLSEGTKKQRLGLGAIAAVAAFLGFLIVMKFLSF